MNKFQKHFCHLNFELCHLKLTYIYLKELPKNPQENKKPSQEEVERASTIPFLVVITPYADIPLPTVIFLLRMALITSIEINTTTPKPNIISRSENEGLIIPKDSRIDGI
jgi:hypothetical protein